MACHVVTDDDLLDLYGHIKSSELGEMGQNLSNCLGTINASLGPAFGLEVRTVALGEKVAPPSGISSQEEDEDRATSSSVAKKNRSQRLVKYHSVVNKLSDSVSKKAAHHGPYARNPHELELLKVVLEKIVERHLDDLESAAAEESEGGDESGNGGSSASGGGSAQVVGCCAGLRRMECINLRTQLKGPHHNKVGLRDAERALSSFVAEGWLIATHKPKTVVTPSPSQDEEDEEGAAVKQDSAGTPSSSFRSHKRSKRSIDGLGVMDNIDAKPGSGNYLMIGPRTYMELPDALTDFGLGRERMPQFILHGSG